MSNKTKKQLLLNLPYFIAGLVCTNLGEAWRIAEGADMSEKLLGFLSALGAAFSNPMPSLHPLDLLIGVCCGAGLRIAVYLKGKNAKKYRHGMEYGSARWGTQKDIEPFEDPVFANNVILTRTERLMMGNRPKNPANARNKNVLVVGGSGSGKTRFWLKPNLLQCHSSYVVTDPKGDIVIDCGQALLKNGYSIRIFNTINFRKSMHYNPFAYIHSEKDILKPNGRRKSFFSSFFFAVTNLYRQPGHQTDARSVCHIFSDAFHTPFPVKPCCFQMLIAPHHLQRRTVLNCSQQQQDPSQPCCNRP